LFLLLKSGFTTELFSGYSPDALLLFNLLAMYGQSLSSKFPFQKMPNFGLLVFDKEEILVCRMELKLWREMLKERTFKGEVLSVW
jgi:hypothetical protein